MDGDIKRSRKIPIEGEDNGKSFPKKHKYECQAISKLDPPTDESDALNALTEAPSSDAPSTDAHVEAPNSDAHVEAPNSDAVVEAPNSDAPVEAPSSDALVDNALVEAPRSDALAELPNSDTLVEAPSSDALLALLDEAPNSDALLDEAPNSDALLDEAPSSEESNEPWNNETMLAPIDYQYYDALAENTSSNESDNEINESSSDTVLAPVENRYDYEDWITEATSDAAGAPAEAPSGDDEEDDDEEGDDMSSEVEDEGQNSSNESKAARSYDSFGNSIEDSFNSDEPDEPERSPTLSEYQARARDASDAERYYDLARDDTSSSEPSSSGHSCPTYY